MLFDGQQLGRYRLVRILGSGGMGDVYLAEDPRIEQNVAIKIIRAEVSPYSAERIDEEANRLFLREARAITRLDHPNILPLFDFGEIQIGDTTIMYLVMPYRQEGSLTGWLRQRTNGPLLSPQEVVYIVRQAADGLQHAHNREVIHRDVKPSNFLLRTREEKPNFPDILLADFGIAHLATATSSASQDVRGTPSYMAPEQWQGEAVSASDQYALAVMTYELLTGRLPFLGAPGNMMYQHISVPPQPPSTFNPKLTPAIDGVLLRALTKQPEQRFASISAFSTAFQQATQEKQIIQETLFTASTSQLEAEDKRGDQTVVPAVSTDALTETPAKTLQIGSDSITYVKPIDTPVLFPTTIRSPQNIAPSDGSTSVVATQRKSHKTTRNPLFLATLFLVAILLISGAGIYVVPLLRENTSAKGVSGVSSHNVSASPNSSDTSIPATSAIVTIIPASSTLNDTYTLQAVTGTPAREKQQVQARLLSTTTQSHAQTVNTTGTQTTPGVQAHGILTFDNGVTPPVTFTAGTTFPNDQTPDIQMVLDQTVTVPGPNRNNDGIATAPAHVLQAGPVGNVVGGTLGVNNPAFYHVINNTMQIYNASNFTGGQAAQTFTVVQQSDIDGAATTLESANAPDAQQELQPLVQPNERLIGASSCKPNVSSDHRVGDRATNVIVTVNYTCTGEVYDYGGARLLTADLLKNQATTNPGNGYVLEGNVKTTIIGATITDVAQGIVTIQASAEGVWTYQFSNVEQHQLAQLIVGKDKQTALHLLAGNPGIGKVTIQLTGGNSTSLPTDPRSISLMVQHIP